MEMINLHGVDVDRLYLIFGAVKDSNALSAECKALAQRLRQDINGTAQSVVILVEKR